MPLKLLPKKAKTTRPTELRSRIMRAVRSKGTKPERAVKSWLRSARFKPLLNERSLPGSPDFVLPRMKVAIFVHGCFWHGHTCKRGARLPATNAEYWVEKLARNKIRDVSAKRKLRRRGWRVLTIWECQTAADVHRQRLLRAVQR